jgi:transcriptional regulator with XRE-family HTH domain
MTQKLPDALLDNPDALREYFVTDWILGAMMQLEKARKAKGLTQQELADRLSRKQSSISRTERDSSGAISLRHYAEWLAACDVIPSSVVTTDLIVAKNSLILHDAASPAVQGFNVQDPRAISLGTVQTYQSTFDNVSFKPAASSASAVSPAVIATQNHDDLSWGSPQTGAA